MPAFYMLNEHLQDLMQASGEMMEQAAIPEMSITEFMRINPRFNTDKARKKALMQVIKRQ